MKPTVLPYLLALQRESSKLSKGMPTSVEPAVLRRAFDQIIAHVIARESKGAELAYEFESAIKAALTGLTEAGRSSASLEALDMLSPWTGTAPSNWPDRLASVKRAGQEIITRAGDIGFDSAQREMLFRAASIADQNLRMGIREAADQAIAGFVDSSETPEEPLTGEAVGACLARLAPEHNWVRAVDFFPVPGYHAKEVYFVDMLDNTGKVDHLVVRRDRILDFSPRSVFEEFPLQRRLFAKGFPVPETVLASNDPNDLGRPIFVIRVVPGKEQPLEEIENPRALFREVAGLIARVHSTPIEELGFAPIPPEKAVESRIAQIEELHHRWRAMHVGPAPAMEWAHAWLRENAPRAGETVALNHGDFHTRNILLDKGRFSSLIDWEHATVSHPAQDLSFIRVEVESVMPWEEFMSVYRDAGGPRVTDWELSYFKIWLHFRNVLITGMAESLFLERRSDEILWGLISLTVHPDKQLNLLTQALEAATANPCR